MEVVLAKWSAGDGRLNGRLLAVAGGVVEDRAMAISTWCDSVREPTRSFMKLRNYYELVIEESDFKCP